MRLPSFLRPSRRGQKADPMTDALHPDMIEATRLTRTGRLAQAMELIQRTLRGSPVADPAPDRSQRTIDLAPDSVEVADPAPSERSPHAHLPEALRSFLDGLGQPGAGPDLGGLLKPRPAAEPLPEGARFLTGSYGNAAGTRSYRLYVPGNHRGRALPLLVMLHGCTQSPDDFAAGTGMNRLAEEHGLLVLYPAQDNAANPQRCWNWFNPEDQERDRGEPSLIAGMTREVMREHAVDPARVYVAGLSAGGAAAANLAATYPDLYAAAGIHSGLPAGAAGDLPSAFAAMRQGAAPSSRPAGRKLVPTIVFHGDQDSTVSPHNGDRIIAQARATAEGLQATAAVQRGEAPGGRAYSRRLHADAAGRVLLEQWVIHGAGHAWAGGSPAGSYTDPQGPDASREMIRFFLEHQQPTAA